MCNQYSWGWVPMAPCLSLREPFRWAPPEPCGPFLADEGTRSYGNAPSEEPVVNTDLSDLKIVTRPGRLPLLTNVAEDQWDLPWPSSSTIRTEERPGGPTLYTNIPNEEAPSVRRVDRPAARPLLTNLNAAATSGDCRIAYRNGRPLITNLSGMA